MLLYFFCVSAALSKVALATNEVVTSLWPACTVTSPIDSSFEIDIQSVTIQDGQYYAEVTYSVPSFLSNELFGLASVSLTEPNQQIYDCGGAASSCAQQTISIPFVPVVSTDGPTILCTPDISLTAKYTAPGMFETTTFAAACDSTANEVASSICWYTSSQEIVSNGSTATTTAAENTESVTSTRETTTATTAERATTTTTDGMTSSSTADVTATLTSAPTTPSVTTSIPEKTALEIYPQCTIVPDASFASGVDLSVTGVYTEDGTYYAEIYYSFPAFGDNIPLSEVYVDQPASAVASLRANPGTYIFSFTPVAGDNDGQLCLPDLTVLGIYEGNIWAAIASCNNIEAITAGTCFFPPTIETTTTAILDVAATTTDKSSGSTSLDITITSTVTPIDISTAAGSTSGTSSSAVIEMSTDIGSTTSALSTTATDSTVSDQSSTGTLLVIGTSTATDASTTDSTTSATLSATATEKSTYVGSTTSTTVTESTVSDQSSTGTIIARTTSISTVTSIDVATGSTSGTSSTAATETSTNIGPTISALSTTATKSTASNQSSTDVRATSTSFSVTTSNESHTTASVSSPSVSIAGSTHFTVASASGFGTLFTAGRSTTKTITLTEGSKIVTTTTVCPLTETTSNSATLTTKVITLTEGTKVYTTTTVCPLTENADKAVSAAHAYSSVKPVSAGAAAKGLVTVITEGLNVYTTTIVSSVWVETSSNPVVGTAAIARESLSPSSAAIKAGTVPVPSAVGTSVTSLQPNLPNAPVESSSAPPFAAPVVSSENPAAAASHSSAVVPANVAAQPSETPLQGSAMSRDSNIIATALSVAFALFLI